MFKYKISIYLDNGNVIRIRAKDYSYHGLSNENKSFTESGMNYHFTIDINKTSAIVLKKWRQHWG